MQIKIVRENKKQFLHLLLLADESEHMIDKYLHRGELFALYDSGLKSVCVVTRESNDTCELKNIACQEQWHGHGYGSKLLQHIFAHYAGKYNFMLVGTGDAPRALRFYQNNGFAISHRVKNFFTDNYDHPMFEDDIQLIDMVYLKRPLDASILIDNLDKLHTTPMGEQRIKSNLSFNIPDIISWCKEQTAAAKHIERKGKNWYVYLDNAIITVNAHSYTVITAHAQ